MGQLIVVLHCLQRILVAPQAQVPDLDRQPAAQVAQGACSALLGSAVVTLQ